MSDPSGAAHDPWADALSANAAATPPPSAPPPAPPSAATPPPTPGPRSLAEGQFAAPAPIAPPPAPLVQVGAMAAHGPHAGAAGHGGRRRPRHVTMFEAVGASMLPFLAAAIPTGIALFLVNLAVQNSMTSMPSDPTATVGRLVLWLVLLQMVTAAAMTFLSFYGVSLVAQAKAGSSPEIGAGLGSAFRACLKLLLIGLGLAVVTIPLGLIVGLGGGGLAAFTMVAYSAVGMVALLAVGVVVVDVVNDAH